MRLESGIALLVLCLAVSSSEAAPKPAAKKSPPRQSPPKSASSPPTTRSPSPSPSPLKPPGPPRAPPTPPSPPHAPPPPPPPPQGKAPEGAPVFLESANKVAPPGYRMALVVDAIYLQTEIMDAIKDSTTGVALGDGWIYKRLNERQYIFSEMNPLLENGTFMYTTLPLAAGPTYQLIVGNASVPYGYRLASCAEARAAVKFVNWPENATASCAFNGGYATPPNEFSKATATCGDAPQGWDISTCAVYILSASNGCEYVTGYTFFQGLDINGSSFEPQPRLVGNNSGIASVCTRRVKCVAFNEEGVLKNGALPTYSQLVPAEGNATCRGLYIPTNRAGCGIEGYNFYWSYDSPGQFGTSATIIPGNSAAIAAVCNRDPTCVGFSTKGRAKVLIQDRSQWTQWTTNKCQGLYIRKNSGFSP